MAHAFKPSTALWRQRQVILFEFQVSLEYLVSSRSAKVIYLDLVSKNENKQRNEKKLYIVLSRLVS